MSSAQKYAKIQISKFLLGIVPRQACMPGCRRIGTYRKASPPSLHARLQTNRNLQEGVPDKPCMSVADCSESSVLRSCTLGPYVPLRRTPSESGSAIRHAELRRRDAFPFPSGSATGHAELRRRDAFPFPGGSATGHKGPGAGTPSPSLGSATGHAEHRRRDAIPKQESSNTEKRF